MLANSSHSFANAQLKVTTSQSIHFYKPISAAKQVQMKGYFNSIITDNNSNTTPTYKTTLKRAEY